ncbi:MAG: hypothetical protein V1720_08380 [bacterium]
MNKMKYFYLAFWFVFIAINGFGCKSGSGETADKKIMIDSTKLDPAISDNYIGVFYHPPINWKPLPPEVSSRMIKKDTANAARELFSYNLSSVFIDSVSRSMLFTGKVKINNPEMDMDDAIEAYSKDIMSKFNPDDIKKDEYENNGITITRFHVDRIDLVAFKLLFTNDRDEIIQFDYSIKKTFYESVEKAIESSIASIKYFK